MKKRNYRSTLLSLVQTVQDYTASDEEAVAIIAHLLNTGRVVLSGTFAGQRIAEMLEPAQGTERAPASHASCAA